MNRRWSTLAKDFWTSVGPTAILVGFLNPGSYMGASENASPYPPKSSFHGYSMNETDPLSIGLSIGFFRGFQRFALQLEIFRACRSWSFL